VRLAVFDLGSTTFQLLVADAERDGSVVPILRDRVVLNLGMKLARAGGHIPDSAGVRATGTVRRFRDLAERAGAERVLPVATSALREAANREELGALLSEAAGEPVRFVDGAEEGRLTLAGVRAGVALGHEPVLLLDLGGGSLEVVVADDGRPRWSESLPLGAGRLTVDVVRRDPPARSERREIRRRVSDLIAPLVERLSEAERPVRCVVSGGTAGALARLLAARRWREVPASLNQFEIRTRELLELAQELGRVDHERRLRLPGVDERRVELLPAGAQVLATTALSFGMPSVVLSEWGFREGVALDALGLGDGVGPSASELRHRAIERLVKVWGEDTAHASVVARVALRLFDGLSPAHGLGVRERDWLARAARVHDIGARISPDRYHKHGAYLVEHAGLRGFSPDEIAVIASVIRFQRGRDPRPSYLPFAGLSAPLRERVVVLTGVLRVAHALGRGHEHDATIVSGTVDHGAVRVHVAGERDPEAAVAEARLQADLLRRALGREISFSTQTLERVAV
jgi:exopolyphosphatase / guanosine-5'-triphosphate,3'-diphosphate pyrophosphatase